MYAYLLIYMYGSRKFPGFGYACEETLRASAKSEGHAGESLLLLLFIYFFIIHSPSFYSFRHGFFSYFIFCFATLARKQCQCPTSQTVQQYHNPGGRGQITLRDNVVFLRTYVWHYEVQLRGSLVGKFYDLQTCMDVIKMYFGQYTGRFGRRPTWFISSA